MIQMNQSLEFQEIFQNYTQGSKKTADYKNLKIDKGILKHSWTYNITENTKQQNINIVKTLLLLSMLKFQNFIKFVCLLFVHNGNDEKDLITEFSEIKWNSNFFGFIYI